ncbi:MAG: transcription initiation factor IIB [Candidatus Methanomethylicia archaeon]|nr:transcription initiation factor IIB [Candidatus Methanomethylicia archaeon]
MCRMWRYLWKIEMQDNLEKVEDTTQRDLSDLQGRVEALTCPECGARTLVRDYERAEVTCTECGLVLGDKLLDPGPEWRAFDSDQRDKRSRAGAPVTLTIHDKGLSTMIDWRDKDSYGKSLTSKKRAQIYRLRKWQRRIRVSDASERNLAFALSELERMSSQLGLSRNIREASALLYRKAVESQLIRGRSIESMTGAALYAACRKYNVPLTLDEVASVSRANKKEIARSYRFVSSELTIRVLPTDPVNYVPRLITKLSLDGAVQRKSVEIIKFASSEGLTSGRGPTGVAAAAVYIASVLLERKRTQRDIATSAGVTEVTVRNRYKELLEKLDLEIYL